MEEKKEGEKWRKKKRKIRGRKKVFVSVIECVSVR